MKNKIIDAIDKHRAEITACGEYVLSNPELGFKEFKTAEYVKKEFEKLNIPYIDNLAITGVKGTVGKEDAEINVCVIGEMDAIKCFEHPNSDKFTGAAHACGHNAQVASMIGAAYGLVKSGVLEELNGKVTFFAVPAEEFAELDFRRNLVDKNEITYMAGKQELIHIGAFDDIDIAMMIHSHALTPEAKLYLKGSSLGFDAKKISFLGKAAHGSEPWNGVNALNAAMIALSAINANRETFKDEDKVRIHPIISNGGDLVNVIPDKAVIETYVRASNSKALKDAANKVDNAVKAGALAVGAECEIENIRGYAPLKQNELLSDIFENAASLFIPKENIFHGINMTGSTDMGDLSEIIPSIQPTLGGYEGALHSKEFKIADKETAYITSSKMLALTVYELLKDNALKANEVITNFKANKN